MKTRQPLPACAGTAFNIVISLADPIRCGLSAALAAEIGWTRRPDATWAAIVVCALGGYLALSRFLAQQLIVTGSILALVYLLMLWVDGFVQGLGDDSTATGRWLKERAGLERQRRERLVLPVGLFLKFAVVVLSVPLILLQWGYRWPDIYDWYSQLFFGFRIGNTQISVAVLLASIIVFGLAYGAAR